MIYRFPKDEDFSYLTGVYLALNAVPDAYLLMDAPDCCYKKIEFIDKNHDLFADLFRTDGFHRIANTSVYQGNAMLDRSDEIEDLLVRMADHEPAGVVWLCSMPMASLTGIQYDLIVRRAQGRSGKPLIEIPSRGLSETWLGGYESVLVRLAEELPLDPDEKQKDTVALVGYFMDRHEGDHLGNLKLFEQVFARLGFELVSVWLGGGGTRKLQEIERAERVISLPYGRKAARVLAERTGAELLELDLPFGVAGSSEWLRRMGEFLGREVEGWIEGELKAVLPTIELVCPQFLLDREITILADVHLGRALRSALEEFGAQVVNTVLFGSSDESLEECSRLELEPGHLCIGNTYSAMIIDAPVRFFQFGFPASGNHYLLSEPTFFYRGFVAFLGRLINAINSRTVLERSGR